MVLYAVHFRLATGLNDYRYSETLHSILNFLNVMILHILNLPPSTCRSPYQILVS